MRRPSSSYTGAWLAMKLGVEPRAIDIRRRSGELLGVQPEKGGDFIYPTWQFDDAGDPLPGVARVIRAAREAGLADGALYDLLQRRDGMTGSGRLLDSVREGREERAVEAIRSLAPRS